jgi:hypothetical protein
MTFVLIRVHNVFVTWSPSFVLLLKKNHETLSIACHVGLHVAYSSIQASLDS